MFRSPKDYYHAFVELHIEQGPLLEREEIPIGIVTAIAAPATLRVRIEGAGGHAGGMLMPDRRDAFLAAAEIALAVEAAAKGTKSIDSVATTGVCNVFPGAVNSVPSRAVLEIDVRDTDLARRDGMLDAIRSACDAAAPNARCELQIELINADAPAQASPLVKEALSVSCEELGLDSHADGQPGVSRFAVHLANRTHRHALHSLPKRIQPPPRRIRLAREHRARRASVGAHAGASGAVATTTRSQPDPCVECLAGPLAP